MAGIEEAIRPERGAYIALTKLSCILEFYALKQVF